MRSSNLPVPYRNPWGQLGDDLRAIGADTRLRGWALWRRNAQGQLWSPAWWPTDLVPLFWPLLLTASVALLLSAVLWITSLLEPRNPPPPSTGAPDGPAAVIPEPLPLDPSPLELDSQAISEREDTPDQGALETDKPVLVEPAQEQPALPPEGLAPPPVDPLLELIQRPEADGLLQAAEAVPEQSLLVLRLRPAFPALSTSEQQRRALQWQEWASALGYEHLELRDSHSGLVARDALVGEGMIVLLDPS